MGLTQTIGGVAVAILLILLCITIFQKPIRLLMRLLMNTIMGFIILFILNFFGKYIGITLGINWINAIVVGIFGLPGVGFLLILKWLLII